MTGPLTLVVPRFVLLALALTLAAGHPTVVGVYPNPVTDGDTGEFVVVRIPAPGNWSIADGESVVRLPADTRGTVAVTNDPGVARAVTDHPVVVVDQGLALSNAGERITLRRNGAAVAALAYPRAPEAAYRTGGEWRTPGRTTFPPVSVSDVRVRAFVLPDDPSPVIETLRAAEERVLLAGYTFTSKRVARALRRAASRGVDVHVLVEGGPVGGVSEHQRAALDGLAEAGVTVTVIDGPRARYAFHHAKYAVVDDRTLVASENWKPSGLGGRSNRGWGAIVESPRFADRLAAVFAADTGWLDGRSWHAYERDLSTVAGRPANDTFPRRFAPVTARADSVRLVLAPDNAGREVRRLVRSANESLYVEQVRIEPGHLFVDEAVAAARRGVDVRVLVSGAWYVREDNENFTRRLNALAAAEDLPLEARVVQPRSRFEKIHVKGVVVDGERALVGSLNWNSNAVRENREAALVLVGEEVGRYYERVFLADWWGGAWRITVGLLIAVACGVLVVLGAGRRVEFEGRA